MINRIQAPQVVTMLHEKLREPFRSCELREDCVLLSELLVWNDAGKTLCHQEGGASGGLCPVTRRLSSMSI